MRIAQEEIFGPVLSVLKWKNEEKMFSEVNSVQYGLTTAIWTSDISTAHRAVAKVEAGFIWVNQSSNHYLGVQFGGYKNSGFGGKLGLACIEALLDCTQVKNVNVLL